LERRFWVEDERTDKGWLRAAKLDEFKTEVGLAGPAPQVWIVVAGQWSVHSSKRDLDVSIRSAMVPPRTGRALVRALQTISNPWDFRIPDESDDHQIDVPPYRLTGWLANIDSDAGFDDNDPLKYEVGRRRCEPGSAVTGSLKLTRQDGSKSVWIASGEVIFRYEAWSDEPSAEEDRYRQHIKSDGWRLFARVDAVQAFLQSKEMGLIFEVQFERRLKSEYSRSYESDPKKRATLDKILLLTADGVVEDAKGRVGTWSVAGRRTQPRQKHGHAQSVDGTSHRRINNKRRGGGRR
jgi:hypothetical protein